MSIFGSLFTAVSGLAAQSQSLSMISNNIANTSTVGYKRSDAAFSSLVTSESRSTLYSPGSVKATQNQRIDQQGILQQSASATDIALSGNGFFVVKNGTGSGAETLFTRAGSFSEDENGALKNTAGFTLYGWPLDQNGALPAGSASPGSLVPVDLSTVTGQPKATTTGALKMNLSSDTALQPYPLDPTTPASFTRALKVYDSLGTAQDMNLEFTHIESPTAIARGGTDLSSVSGMLAGQNGFSNTDTFDISVDGAVPATTTITLDGGVSKMLADINAIVDASGKPLVNASLDPSGNLTIKARDLTANITLADGSGAPLAGGLGMAGGGTYTPPATATNLLATPNSTNNPEGWWQVTVKSPGGAVLSSGQVNFDGTGTLNAAVPANGQIPLAINNINWGDGSNTQNISLDIANLTQHSGDFDVISATQNGAAPGVRTGVSIDADGYVSAQFSNGQSQRVFKLAVATFANANGLDSLTGNVFRESDTSGTLNLREAGTGSAGNIQGGALEESNVDLADEFSKMIVTQRAYSANTKVITTADQMTQELLQLR
ncbi:MAG: flagellar hook protein FlgE [Micavibrio sp.]|nr:flagellar hook protein FlgE [Micavibrio sp.]